MGRLAKKHRGLKIQGRISEVSACTMTRRLCGVLGYDKTLLVPGFLYLLEVGSFGQVKGRDIRRSNPHVRHDVLGGVILGFAPDCLTKSPIGYVCPDVFRVSFAKAGDAIGALLLIREDFAGGLDLVAARNLFGRSADRTETWIPEF